MRCVRIVKLKLAASVFNGLFNHLKALARSGLIFVQFYDKMGEYNSPIVFISIKGILWV